MSSSKLVSVVDEFATSSGRTIQYYSLPALQKTLGSQVTISRLPISIRILLESLLRNKDGKTITDSDVIALASWNASRPADREIPFKVGRVLMQDLTGVPALVDLAAMRDAVVAMNLDSKIIEPEVPIDLIIDHSIQVDAFRNQFAFQINAEKEIERNRERYEFLKWAQQAFRKLKLVPPDTGICHQVNLEFLATVAMLKDLGGSKSLAYPDTLVGTDSHTPMINGLGVLGWGVGGIEAEAALLGQPVTFITPRVVGVHLSGELLEGVTATDVVLTITQTLRNLGVVDAFVEFFGEGVKALTVAGRATISNMTPEFGATASLFPVDEETLHYLRLTGRSESHVEIVRKYYEAQQMFGVPADGQIDYSTVVNIDLSEIEPSVAGPTLPHDRSSLANVGKHLLDSFPSLKESGKKDPAKVTLDGKDFPLSDGDVVIAAITSCTNTSNPDVMIAAGLLAKRAVELGLSVRDVVKTSMAPGSMVVTEYLKAMGLLPYLEKLGFGIVGYGCTTCIGNSGPLPVPVSRAIRENNLTTAAVLSGNRNFEARIHQDVRANFLMSPPLVVAYALAGNMKIDLTREPIGNDSDGHPVFLKDLWPSHRQVMEYETMISTEMFHSKYAQVYDQNSEWNKLNAPTGLKYVWNKNSTYIQQPPYFEDYPERLRTGEQKNADIFDARPLLILGDYVTTDHISPAGAIGPKSAAGKFLLSKGVSEDDFNTYGSRRGNHEVMIRGTFANPRIKNLMVGGVEGSLTKYYPDGETMSVYDAAMKYKNENTPLLVVAGKGFGTGSSRDWAAKGQKLLGVKAVVAESFERIHRSNLIGMGVLPLQFEQSVNAKTLALDGSETFSITGLEQFSEKSSRARLIVSRKNGEKLEANLRIRLDSQVEREYYESGGILDYVLRRTVKARSN
ncbi:MAG TPA: aconitate hydratase AcnA [Nitrososphaerales archaeon]|nr:aconitate hydratase AcnA [Nitrososphaerales archaeon]